MLEVMKVTEEFADIAYKIQQESFTPLLHKYHDYDINPAMETVEIIREKINKSNTSAYTFRLDNINVGWVRVSELEDKIFKISGLCVLPEYQNKGIAQEALKIIERIFSDALQWLLFTINEEKGNCHLYEKLGYGKTGNLKKINDKMSIVQYVKHMGNMQSITFSVDKISWLYFYGLTKVRFESEHDR